MNKKSNSTNLLNRQLVLKSFQQSSYAITSFFIIFLIPLLLLVIPTVHASEEGHITLLTVSEDTNRTGGVADLYLRIEPGTGAVFVDSFPLTKIDTQSSIRYANRVACDYLQKDCTRYNFYYTIRANSAIVGGPSAGAAITVLTIGVLDNQKIDQNLALTGTINSGGIIGPVAGITSKVKGAKSAGITTVLIPSIGGLNDSQDSEKLNSSTLNISMKNISSNSSNNSTLVVNINQTISGTVLPIVVKRNDLSSGIVPELSSSSFKVIRVSNIDDALIYVTGKNYSKVYAPVVPSAEYIKRMSLIADNICARNKELRSSLLEKGIRYNDTNNYTARSNNTTRLYSRASLCFSGDIELAKLDVTQFSLQERKDLLNELQENVLNFSAELHEKNLNTISDLETYAIVQERILDTKNILDELNESDPDPETLGYARERFLSAKIWTEFFGMSGRSLPEDRSYLSSACLSKLSEAEERVNYVRLYAPNFVGEADRAIEDAQGWAKDEPVLCIFSASKATAQANLLASVIVVGEDNIDALIVQKLRAADSVLRREQQAGFFPIIGYSYLDYSTDLRFVQPYSSLNFAEYALELSTLDIYFPKEHSFSVSSVLLQTSYVFFFGMLLGGAIVFIIMKQKAIKLVDSMSKSSRVPKKVIIKKRSK